MKVFSPAAATFAAAVLTAAIGLHAAGATGAGDDPHAQAADLMRKAYFAAYSLDYGEATTLARRAVGFEPSESRTHRTLASILWLQILFKRGAITVDHFMGSVTKSEKSLPKPPADLDVEFQVELTRATDLAEAKLRSQPNNLDAQEDVASVCALQASYLASIKASLTSALGPAKRAFQTDEAVLQKDPSRSGAAFVVGIYRYVVSTFALPTRLFAYIAGFSGDKDKGIALLEGAAASGEAHFEACAALMLIYTKEGRHKDAMALAKKLEMEFPRNRLFILEEGSAAARAGLGAEADAALTRGLRAFDQDPRPKFPGEAALWSYKRGIARTQMGHLDDAGVDLRNALGQAPTGWVNGRIHLQMGRVADLRGHRPDALTEYREARRICDSEDDPICSDEAARLLKQPYTGK